ncbi:MAG: stimulus-sensing domain-containing protein [Alphaproteobacteria bacterium]
MTDRNARAIDPNGPPNEIAPNQDGTEPEMGRSRRASADPNGDGRGEAARAENGLNDDGRSQDRASENGLDEDGPGAPLSRPPLSRRIRARWGMSRGDERRLSGAEADQRPVIGLRGEILAPQTPSDRSAPPLDTGRRPSRRSRLFFSSLTVRIASLNFIGLVIFMVGLILSSQFRNSAVDERLLALHNHGKFVAGALEQTALVPRLGHQEGQPYDAIDRVAAVEILRRLVAPTEYRARVYDYDGTLIYDSWLLDDEGQVTSRRLMEPAADRRFFTIIDEIFQWLTGPALSPPHIDLTRPLPELEAALSEAPRAGDLQSVRRNEDGHLIVSVASPVKNVRAYVGAVLMSTQGDAFEGVLWQERRAIFQVFLIALAMNLLIALLYGSTVVRPIRKLAQAADQIRFAKGRSGESARARLPDFSRRADEIGNLAESLRAMTEALNTRLVAIEQFAADVSHEIKTPLTSLRSAMETFDIAPSDDARRRLIDVMKHDVDRLDRLITDISNASRLDAELSREDSEPVQVPNLLRNIREVYTVAGIDREIRVASVVKAGARGETALTVNGMESRLGQVIHNLVENAISFSPDGGMVTMIAQLERQSGRAHVRIMVEDEGPGIPEDSLTKIFDRFYTSRPAEADFGKNSGLGLSISRQIIEAHGGQIWAENRYTTDGTVAGARFVVRLPAVSVK